MDANQLQELANNVRIDHWPPHLGVTTDAEKVEYLAQRLREAADMATENDDLITELNELRDKVSAMEDSFEEKVQSLRDDLDNFELKIEEGE